MEKAALVEMVIMVIVERVEKAAFAIKYNWLKLPLVSTFIEIYK